MTIGLQRIFFRLELIPGQPKGFFQEREEIAKFHFTPSKLKKKFFTENVI